MQFLKMYPLKKDKIRSRTGTVKQITIFSGHLHIVVYIVVTFWGIARCLIQHYVNMHYPSEVINPTSRITYAKRVSL